MAPFSQELEPPGNPAQFTKLHAHVFQSSACSPFSRPASVRAFVCTAAWMQGAGDDGEVGMTFEDMNTAVGNGATTVGPNDGRVEAPAAGKKGRRSTKGKTTPKQLADLAAAIEAAALSPKKPTNGSRSTKAALVLGRLREPQGITIAELIEATGWQAHSVRGFLSGTVKTKLSLPLVSAIGDDGVRRYRVVVNQSTGDGTAVSKAKTPVAASVGAAR